METPDYHPPHFNTIISPSNGARSQRTHTHLSHVSHREHAQTTPHSNTDTIPITTREQEQGASGAPSPPARPNRKRPAPPQTATQGLVASGASSLTTGKRRRTQHRPRVRSPPPHTDHSRNHISQHSNTTQEMEASGATSLMDGPSGHTNPLRHTQSRQCVYEGGTRGALTSTHLTTSLAASRPTPTPHNGRPGSWRGGRRHRLGGGGKSKGGRGGGGNRSRVRREQGEKEAGHPHSSSPSGTAAHPHTYPTSSQVGSSAQAAVPVGQVIFRASSRPGNPSDFPMLPPGRPPDQELLPGNDPVEEWGIQAAVVQPSNSIIYYSNPTVHK